MVAGGGVGARVMGESPAGDRAVAGSSLARRMVMLSSLKKRQNLE